MLDALYQNPMQYIGLLFALVGAFGAVLFGAGLLAGLPGVFTMAANEDHQEHHELRITWGAMLMTAAFIVWELIRAVASWFGYPPADTHAFGLFLGTLAVALIACGIVVLITNIITKKNEE